jgi:hypothetical protein
MKSSEDYNFFMWLDKHCGKYNFQTSHNQEHSAINFCIQISYISFFDQPNV